MPERAVEGQLGGLRPEHVGPREQRVEARVVLAGTSGAWRISSAPPRSGSIPARRDHLAEARLHLRRARPATSAIRSEPGLERAAEAGQELRRHPRLRAGAADREGEERRPPLLLARQRAEEVRELLRHRAAELAGGIEPHEPRREVPLERRERRAAHERVGQREAGEGDPLLRHAVGAEPPRRAPGRARGTGCACARGSSGRPDPVQVGVGHDAEDPLEPGRGRRRSRASRTW